MGGVAISGSHALFTPHGLSWFECSVLSEKQGPPKVSSSNLSSLHCAQPYIFSNDMPPVESLQLEETCSSIFWGQFFMTET